MDNDWSTDSRLVLPGYQRTNCLPMITIFNHPTNRKIDESMTHVMDAASKFLTTRLPARPTGPSLGDLTYKANRISESNIHLLCQILFHYELATRRNGLANVRVASHFPVSLQQSTPGPPPPTKPSNCSSYKYLALDTFMTKYQSCLEKVRVTLPSLACRVV